MARIVETERPSYAAGPGLSYQLGAKLHNQPLAMEVGAYWHLKAAIDEKAFDSALPMGSPVASKFVGTLDTKSKFRVTDDGVAIVAIQGTLFDRGAFLGDLGGWATSYEGLSEQLRRLSDDPAITSIVLDIDSPGGMVSGLYDLTAQLGKLKKKKVYALAANMADSAAYAIACCADEVFVTRNGEIGSIGVVSMHQSYERMLNQSGIDTTFIYYGDHKIDGTPYQGLSPGAKAQRRERVDMLGWQFCEHVAKQRGLEPEAVKAMQALTFMGEDAVKAGLADGVKSIDEVLDHIRNGKSTGRGKSKGGRTVSERNAAAERPEFDYTALAGSIATAMAANGKAAAAAPAVIDAAAAPKTEDVLKAERERYDGILSSAHAKDRQNLARALAKQGMTLAAAEEILKAAGVETAASATVGDALAVAMRNKANSAGVSPDAAAADAGKKPSMAEITRAKAAKMAKRS